MNEGKFKISIADSIKFLKDTHLFKGNGIGKSGDYSAGMFEIGRTKRHVDIYDYAITNLDYEILLFDDSIFQFAKRENYLRYAFIQNPRKHLDKLEYLRNFYSSQEIAELSEDVLEDLISGINLEQYEQFLNEQDINLDANYFRYDLDEKGYAPLIHPYSHIHFGMNERIRLACSKVITPLKFVIFCVKNTYLEQWENSFNEYPQFALRIKSCKDICEQLPSNRWQKEDMYELFLI